MSFTERRKNQRVADAIGLHIEPQKVSADNCDLPIDPTLTDKVRLQVVRLSSRGIRLTSKSKLPTNAQLRLSILLASRDQPLTVNAQVAACTETRDGRNHGFQTRLLFTDMDSGTEQVLKSHIAHVIRSTRPLRELPYRAS